MGIGHFVVERSVHSGAACSGSLCLHNHNLHLGGVIAWARAQAAMQSLGYESKNDTIFTMLAELDKDGNAALEFEDLAHTIVPHSWAIGDVALTHVTV